MSVHLASPAPSQDSLIPAELLRIRHGCQSFDEALQCLEYRLVEASLAVHRRDKQVTHPLYALLKHLCNINHPLCEHQATVSMDLLPAERVIDDCPHDGSGGRLSNLIYSGNLCFFATPDVLQQEGKIRMHLSADSGLASWHVLWPQKPIHRPGVLLCTGRHPCMHPAETAAAPLGSSLHCCTPCAPHLICRG